jgi:hypothetical protein
MRMAGFLEIEGEHFEVPRRRRHLGHDNRNSFNGWVGMENMIGNTAVVHAGKALYHLTCSILCDIIHISVSMAYLYTCVSMGDALRLSVSAFENEV